MSDPHDLLASDLGDRAMADVKRQRRLDRELDLSIWFEALLIATVGAIAVAQVVAG
jgi:hypothetical protein